MSVSIDRVQCMLETLQICEQTTADISALLMLTPKIELLSECSKHVELTRDLIFDLVQAFLQFKLQYGETLSSLESTKYSFLNVKE